MTNRSIRWAAVLWCFILFFPLSVIAHSRPVGIVSLTMDDALADEWNGFVIANKYGIKGTIFITTSIAGSENGLSWDQLRTMHQAGWEIGAHTHTHTDLTTQSRLFLQLELEYPKYKIRDEIGSSPSSFALPMSKFNEVVLEEVGKHYLLNFVQGFGNDVNDPAIIYPLLISRLEIGLPTTNAKETCQKITDEANRGKWIVLLVHGIVPEAPKDYQISTAVFEDVMKCVKSFRDDGILVSVTAKEGFEMLPALRNSMEKEKNK